MKCGPQWISRMSAYIAKEGAAHKSVLDTLSGERAAELITSSVSADLNVVSFDAVEASRLKVKLGDVVSVAPTDNGMSHMVLVVSSGVLRLWL